MVSLTHFLFLSPCRLLVEIVDWEAVYVSVQQQQQQQQQQQDEGAERMLLTVVLEGGREGGRRRQTRVTLRPFLLVEAEGLLTLHDARRPKPSKESEEEGEEGRGGGTEESTLQVEEEEKEKETAKCEVLRSLLTLDAATARRGSEYWYVLLSVPLFLPPSLPPSLPPFLPHPSSFGLCTQTHRDAPSLPLHVLSKRLETYSNNTTSNNINNNNARIALLCRLPPSSLPPSLPPSLDTIRIYYYPHHLLQEATSTPEPFVGSVIYTRYRGREGGRERGREEGRCAYMLLRFAHATP
jgi:hypothetical protein